MVMDGGLTQLWLKLVKIFKHLRLCEHISSALPPSTGSLETAHANDRFLILSLRVLHGYD